MRGPSTYNNFVIYKNVFWHSIHQSNLYAKYPAEYFDQNLYGPLFAILIAPFAILPDLLALISWILVSMWVLQKSLSYFWGEKPPFILWLFILLEACTSVHNFQFNLLMAGGLLWSFALVKQQKDWVTTLIIIVLVLTKIYGLVGLLLVFFTKEPKRFVMYCVAWTLLGLILPSILSSPAFVYQSYLNWYEVLVHKNELNQISYSNGGMQDISAMGLFKRISGYYTVSNVAFLLPAFILTLLPIFRFKLLKNSVFQTHYFAQVLIGLVIFSSSSESSTYIIAVSGFVIWILTDYKNTKYIWLLILLGILTVLSPTDIVPLTIRRDLVIKYALKALPLLITWFWISGSLLLNKYSSDELRAS
jgi:hypothetical protein